MQLAERRDDSEDCAHSTAYPATSPPYLRNFTAAVRMWSKGIGAWLPSRGALLCLVLACYRLSEAQEIEEFTGSLQIVNGQGTYSGTDGDDSSYKESGQGTTAVQAQCPANFPVSCTNIQQPYYCCPSNNYCSWANSVVACCPNGKTCHGSVQQPQVTYYQQAAPTTVYKDQPGATVIIAGGGIVTKTEHGDASGQYGYCSTLTAVGPGLPTTGTGECGTILIVAADAIQRAVLDVGKVAFMVFGLNLLGGALLLRR